MAGTGHAQVVLVEGEAGIGKSRLLGEMLAEGERRGISVLSGQAQELEQGRPFGSVAEALGVRPQASDRQRAAIGRLIAGDVPSQGGGAPAGGPLPDLGFRITESLLGLLQTLASEEPLVLCLEDLHWADPSTLRVVGAISRRLRDLPILLAAAFRPAPRRRDLDGLIDGLLAGGGTHITLGPLDDEAVAALAQWAVGASPGPLLLKQVAGASGNPLFVLELVRALEQEGSIEVTGDRAETRGRGLPGSLRSTVLRRLRSLPEGTMRLLQLCSVLGSSFPLRELSAVAGRSASDLLPILQEAIRAGVIGASGEELRFRHELVRAAVYEELPAAIRKGLCEEVGRALRAAGVPLERAAHYIALGASPGDREAAAWLRQAGVGVAGRSVPIAVDLLERARRIAPDDDPGGVALTADLAPLLVLAGRIDDGAALSEQALVGRPEPSERLRLRVALAHALVQQGRWRAASDHAEQAGAGLPEPVRSLTLAPASYISLTLGRRATAAAQAQAARTAATQLGSEVARATALMTLTGTADAVGDLEDAVRCGNEAVRIADRARGAFAGFLFPELMLSAVLTDCDRAEEAEDVARRGLERAQRSGSASLLVWYHSPLVVRLLYLGQWDDAVAEAEASLALADETGTRWMLYPSAVRARIEIARGDLAAAQRTLAAVDRELRDTDLTMGGDWAQWTRALLAEALGEPAEVVAQAMARAWDALPEIRFMFGNWPMAVDATRLALAAGDRARAVSAVEQIEEVADRGRVPSVVAASLRARGLLEDDLELLLGAVDAYRRSPRPVERAWACEDAAEASGRAGRTRDARSLFEEALAAYQAVGATRDAAGARHTMRSLGIRRGARGPRRRPTSGWAALTPTELSVVALVAQGLTNPQIAERRFVSRHTVESHLKHVFAKLGLSSRTELAAEFTRRAAARERDVEADAT